MRAMTQSLALTLHGPPLQPPRVFEKQLHSQPSSSLYDQHLSIKDVGGPSKKHADLERKSLCQNKRFDDVNGPIGSERAHGSEKIKR